MKKIYVLISFILIFLFGYLFYEHYVNNTEHENYVVYYIPHQDDEVITFGVSIYSDIKEGKSVQIVLLTDGSASKVREKLGLTIDEFVNARNREMELALTALGVDLGNLHRQNFKDGELTVKQVENVIKEFAKKFPNAEHKTFSYYDPHHDHSNAGQALSNMLEAGIIKNASFYIGPNFMPPDHIEVFMDNYEETFYPFILAASRSYNILDESKGFYGIGWKSVPQYFEFLEENPRSIYHK